MTVNETRIPVGKASLDARSIGHGRPVIVLHGGPDFDRGYLLPELDLLADGFRLIYYDQRGRGRSAENVRPEDVTLASDLDDVDRVIRHFGAETAVLLGHSWGCVLALEYALRHPARVSHLVLMNPAPASAGDVAVMRRAFREKLGEEMDRQREIVASRAYQEGSPDAVTARYRIHFRHALRQPEHYQTLMARMEAAFRAQGAEGVVLAQSIEHRLYRDTYEVAGYDLLPQLAHLDIPALIISGDHDFCPPEVAGRIAAAIPNATLTTIEDCGHFAYLECPTAVCDALDEFFRGSPPFAAAELARPRAR